MTDTPPVLPSGTTQDVTSTEDIHNETFAARHLHDAGLTLVATPIGNLGDFSPRAAEALRSADLILCEDTRVTTRLLQHYNIRSATEALHDHNEERRIPGLTRRLHEGAHIALVSDAGMPLMSDPGFRLMRAAIAENIPVTAVPGANAALTALVLSGLPPHPFTFLGFPPPRQSARQAAFQTMRAAELAGFRSTLIWHEAPHRIAEMIDDLATVFGETRQMAVARELTKKFEEVIRGTTSELAVRCREVPPRGEITVLLAPPDEASAPTEDQLDEQLTTALQSHSVRDAAQLVMNATGLPRKTVYARALELAAQKRN
ncbi:MAG: 16S rRNA (cytidine(1402)-2'-O)-methyltransferase [Acetobacter sp.]|jgi:16S rRNA (cytidine1402-2'-O)-methyltransferase|nr:16S rRNA (cytidine(1402)-2'-O)-methyltransferase [Acetobacter sp.]MCH4062567.1 16S rRNA (cytidine(1402)-2'-O)-methyltransferase [Acetobacter sp.]MCH4088587.1 16S rRNA (cytidine(1402)-2'-O)-methyltransferase [Acetobacter sp.]MCI1294054.1 16S rRNA (cytidine(1402)-2'-O)-methyltransferase [Acetobacter sp.]MCI1320555.1 16S rRNA (cytidine(1402)-2'-O)-methyltransferase [Acetobacter sp.]